MVGQTDMYETRQWVLETHMESRLFILNKENNLPAKRTREFLTPYALLEQNMLSSPRQKLFLGLEIPTNADHVCLAYQEAEAFARSLGINRDVPVTLHVIGMTDKPEEWPQGIDFLRVRSFSQCSVKWAPVDHYRDPKNRVTFAGAFSTAATTRGLCTVLQEQHSQFCQHDDYRAELTKDYLAALNAEPKHPSLAMLFYAKVLERIVKREYRNPKNQFMNDRTRDALIRDMNLELTDSERSAARDVLLWRHNKSEAHLITMGAPTQDELRLCKKMARFFLTRALGP